jgi:hypothetical protein
MSGQARATFLSGINKDIQRRQLERLCPEDLRVREFPR